MRALIFAYVAVALASSAAEAAPIGAFQSQGDVGSPHLAGSVRFDRRAGAYLVTGGGRNIWTGADGFHFVRREAPADLSIAADVRWTTPGGDPHRKAGVMIRQGLEPDAPYVDIMVHGNGEVSMQYREVKGGDTKQIVSGVKAARRIRLERRGDDFSFWVSGPDGKLQPAGGPIHLYLAGQAWVGLAVCAHNDAVTETAEFTQVKIEPGRPAPDR
jgi:hypothetical protein